MPNQTNDNEKQPNKNRQGSGSDYHQKHAGNVEGYGEIYPDAKNSVNMNEKS